MHRAAVPVRRTWPARAISARDRRAPCWYAETAVRAVASRGAEASCGSRQKRMLLPPSASTYPPSGGAEAAARRRANGRQPMPHLTHPADPRRGLRPFLAGPDRKRRRGVATGAGVPGAGGAAQVAGQRDVSSTTTSAPPPAGRGRPNDAYSNASEPGTTDSVLAWHADYEAQLCLERQRPRPGVGQGRGAGRRRHGRRHGWGPISAYLNAVSQQHGPGSPAGGQPTSQPLQGRPMPWRPVVPVRLCR